MPFQASGTGFIQGSPYGNLILIVLVKVVIACAAMPDMTSVHPPLHGHTFSVVSHHDYKCMTLLNSR